MMSEDSGFMLNDYELTLTELNLTDRLSGVNRVSIVIKNKVNKLVSHESNKELRVKLLETRPKQEMKRGMKM